MISRYCEKLMIRIQAWGYKRDTSSNISPGTTKPARELALLAQFSVDLRGGNYRFPVVLVGEAEEFVPGYQDPAPDPSGSKPTIGDQVSD
jgi:hypothetical protein